MINLKLGTLDPKPVFFTTTLYYHIPSAVAQGGRDLGLGETWWGSSGCPGSEVPRPLAHRFCARFLWPPPISLQ